MSVETSDDEERERKEDGIFPRIYIYIYMCIVCM